MRFEFVGEGPADPETDGPSKRNIASNRSDEVPHRVGLTRAEQVANRHGRPENPGVDNRPDELWSLLGLDHLLSGLAGHPESVI